MRAAIWAFASAAKNRRRHQRLQLEPGAKITTPGARAVGCKDFLIGMERRCGRPFNSPMQELDVDRWEERPHWERRANCARRSSRWNLPRPPLRDFTKEMRV